MILLSASGIAVALVSNILTKTCKVDMYDHCVSPKISAALTTKALSLPTVLMLMGPNSCFRLARGWSLQRDISLDVIPAERLLEASYISIGCCHQKLLVFGCKVRHCTSVLLQEVFCLVHTTVHDTGGLVEHMPPVWLISRRHFSRKLWKIRWVEDPDHTAPV